MKTPGTNSPGSDVVLDSIVRSSFDYATLPPNSLCAIFMLRSYRALLHCNQFIILFASNYGIGAVLYQLLDGEENAKNIRYISFVARSLQPSERYDSSTHQQSENGLQSFLHSRNCNTTCGVVRHFMLYTY